MFLPLVETGIEKPGALAGLGVKRRQIGPFIVVTVKACVGKIVYISLAAMLPSNDVINLVLNEFRRLWDMAVFASFLRTVDET